ncbi:hypothetical protein ACHQM5_013037 [Ranunculus cassubicifolius]
MPKAETQPKDGSNPPSPGYPADKPEKKKNCCCTRSKKKGDRGFIEGCLFALCCCWLCEECCI